MILTKLCVIIMRNYYNFQEDTMAVVTIIGSAMLELIFRNEKLRKLIY